MDEIKVSVVVPFYNNSEFLEECIKSICGQTLKDIEILFIDDCSTDNSLDLINKYSKQDKRIKILRNQKHSGAGAARNIGLKFAQGEYIIFLDADDIFSKDLLSDLYNLAKKKNSDIVFSRYSIIDRNGEVIANNQGVSNNIYENVNYAIFLEKINIFRISTPAPWNKLYRRKFIIDNGIFFQELTTCNDVYFAKRSFVDAKTIYFKDKELVKYRRYIGNNITSSRCKHSDNNITANGKVLKYLTQSGKSKIIIKFFYISEIKIFLYECNNINDYKERKEFIRKIYKFIPKKYFIYVYLQIKLLFIKNIIKSLLRIKSVIF